MTVEGKRLSYCKRITQETYISYSSQVNSNWEQQLGTEIEIEQGI